MPQFSGISYKHGEVFEGARLRNAPSEVQVCEDEEPGTWYCRDYMTGLVVFLRRSEFRMEAAQQHARLLFTAYRLTTSGYG